MNALDITFDVSPWQALFQTKQRGDTVTAGSLLTLLEGADDDAVEDAFADLEDRGLMLSTEDLPRGAATGEAALRLKREADLANRGLEPRFLEDTDPLRIYLEELAQIPSVGEEERLSQAAAAGDASARLALTNLGLSRVKELACTYTGYGVLLMDLIQEGSLGLWQAVSQYRAGDYAAHRDYWICLYLAKAVTLQARADGVGQKIRTAMSDYREVDQRLLSELGRNATLAEIALELHMTEEEAAPVKKNLDDARLLAMNTKPAEPEDVAEETEDQSVEHTALFQMRQRISDMLSALEELDCRLLTLRFGLEGGLPMSPEEVGNLLGLTPEEVVQREAAALASLRRSD